MKLGIIFSLATALVGDFSAKYLAEYQPEKLAAAEWHFETTEGADLIFFGILDDEDVKYKIRVPKLLSFLAYSSFKSEVKGLHEYPEEDRPPLYIHYFFDTMVTIGVLMILLSMAYVLGKWGKWKWIDFVSWNFYSSRRTIKTYKFGQMHICTYEQFHKMSEQHWIEFGYYPKYVKRLK